MPSVTVHLCLADQVLDHWRRRGSTAPFDADDRTAANAFLQGAMGPDLGYVPGGHRPLSDLAHCLHTGDLTRALIRRARCARERAFAWGWVTHVLADTLIHPMVGCAVGELVHGSPGVFEDGDRQPVAHVRVEAGLDALYAQRFPALRRIRHEPVFDGDGIDFLVGAFVDTYGAAPAPRRFLRSHANAVRRGSQGVKLAAFTARTLPRDLCPLRTGHDPDAGILAPVRSFLGSTSVGLGYLLPVMPPLWFLNAVRDVEETFVDLFLEEFELRGAGLANVNLDTGRPDVEEQSYGGLQRSLDLLRRLGGRLPDPTSAPGVSAAATPSALPDRPSPASLPN